MQGIEVPASPIGTPGDLGVYTPPIYAEAPPPLEFESNHPWRPYDEEHPATQYLSSLVPDSLTVDQRAVVEGYTRNHGSDHLNFLAERGEVRPETELLDSAIAQGSLPQPTIVYRGAGPERADPRDFPPGTIFQERRYVSTTLSRALAEGWRASSTIMRIELPAGTPVAVASIREAELLLARNCRFEVTSAEEVIDGGREYTYINVRLLPHEVAVSPEATAYQVQSRESGSTDLGDDKQPETPPSGTSPSMPAERQHEEVPSRASISLRLKTAATRLAALMRF